MVPNTVTRNVAEAVQMRPQAADKVAAPVLRVLGLQKAYRTGFWRQRNPALAGVSFLVPHGSVFALLGHNGAGKTTTMKCILDLVHPDAGSIEIFGSDHRDWRCRSRIGYLPENPYFHEHLTGWELLDFYGRLFGMTASARQQRSEEVLAQVRMQRHAGIKLRKYSKGMLQRIGIAQAILNQPDLLILDEPMSGLDPLGRREVRELLGEMKRHGTTILLSTHIVPDVEALADHVAVLEHGHMHIIHDMAEPTGPVNFEVTLARLPHDPIAEEVLRDCRYVAERSGRAGAVIEVPDVERLQRLLAWCSDLGAEVRAVQTRRSGLEDLFLAALSGTERREQC